jgi:hypothetical protein
MSEEKLTEALMDGHAEVDGIVEDEGQRYRDRLKDLLENPRSRNLLIWKAYGVDPYLYEETIESLSKKNAGRVGDALQSEIGGLIAACKFQANVEITYRGISRAAEKAVIEKHRAARNMDASDLRAYAARTRKKLEFEQAKERRKNGKGGVQPDKQPA